MRAKVAQSKGDDLMVEERVLYEFSIDGGTYYDGTDHSIGECDCTLTNERLIIKGARGRTQQIVLRNISAVTPRIGILNKALDINIGSFSTMRIYGKKDKLLEIARMINEAMAAPS
jgi:Bacterial PH domain